MFDLSQSVVLQKTAFSLVRGRHALGSPGWLFVRSSPCQKWQDGCCLPPSDHIQSETLFQTRQDQKVEWMVLPVFRIVYTGSCLFCVQKRAKYTNGCDMWISSYFKLRKVKLASPIIPQRRICSLIFEILEKLWLRKLEYLVFVKSTICKYFSNIVRTTFLLSLAFRISSTDISIRYF